MSKRYIFNRNDNRLIRQEKQQEDRRRIEAYLGMEPGTLNARGVDRLLTQMENIQARGLA